MEWVKLKDTPTVSSLRTAAYEQEKQWENKRIRLRQERALLAVEESEAHRGKQRNRNQDGGSQQHNASNASNFGNKAQNNSSSNTGSISSSSSNNSSNSNSAKSAPAASSNPPASNNSSASEPASGDKSRRPGICHFCKRRGHSMNECYKYKNQ